MLNLCVLNYKRVLLVRAYIYKNPRTRTIFIFMHRLNGTLLYSQIACCGIMCFVLDIIIFFDELVVIDFFSMGKCYLYLRITNIISIDVLDIFA